MVDVGDKQATERVAVAEGYIEMLPQTLALIEGGGHKKGDVLGIARIAGIMASKRTAAFRFSCKKKKLNVRRE